MRNLSSPLELPVAGAARPLRGNSFVPQGYPDPAMPAPVSSLEQLKRQPRQPGEASFFREQHHFDILAQHLRSHKPGGNGWKVWCSAASTGEEPYSILMTAVESLGASASFQLMASDIDSRVLETASRGVYRAENLKGVSTERLHRFFLRGRSANSGMVRIKPELRRMVDFLNVNLIAGDWPFRETFDIVFCRNVMIYFDAPTQRRVLERIHQVMRPGGLLFVGHAENFSDSRDLFALKGKTVYERQ